jgi:exodeoxyribonuclease VII large subunit
MAEKNTSHIYTVSRLTRQIKSLLEERFPFVWITGEISNYSVPSSGHSYFTLKDDIAVISCVMFRNQKRNLKFSPENGMKIYGLARLGLYEPRGSYQLIFEHIEPEDAGSAQIAFEQLK